MSDIVLNRLNFTENVKTFINGLNGVYNRKKWKDFPPNIQDKLEKSWDKLGFNSDLKGKVFHVEHITPRKITRNGGLNIHTNNLAIPGVEMSFLYYYDINGINSELKFYKKIPSRYTILKKIGLGATYEQTNSKKINNNGIIAFDSKLSHQPHTQIINKKKAQRKVLAIYVTNYL